MKSRVLMWGVGGLVALLATLAAVPGAGAGDDPHALAVQAFDLRMAGQVDEAVALLEEGLAEAPDAGVLHYELARARLLLLDIAGTHEAATAAVASAPDDNEFRYFAAMAAAYAVIDAAHQNDQERMKAMGRESLDQLDAILAADLDFHRARWFLVQLGAEMAPQLGLEVADPAANTAVLEKKDPILGAKARCCLVDQAAQAELWKKVLAEHPGDCRALKEAGAGLVQAGELDLAEKCLEEAIALDPQETYGLLGLGLAYFMKQDWEKAAALTERYLETEPPLALKAYATGRLAMIHQKMGDAEGAKALREKAREIDPHVWPTVMPPPEEIFAPI
jgi:tetratricopeptide (TPR) repeat protein